MNPLGKIAPVKRTAVTVIVFIAAYVLLDWVSFIHEYAPLGITPWNPQPGLGLALLLVFGLEHVPALFAAAVLADILVRQLPAPLPPTVLSAFAIGLFYGLAAALLKNVLRIDLTLARLRDVLWLLAVSLAAALAVAVSYVGIFTLSGQLSAADFIPAAARFWVGDMIGIAVLAPLLLVLRRRRWIAPRGRAAVEMLAQAASIPLVLWIVFGLDYTDEFKFFFLLFLPPIWIAVRHGLEGAVIGVVVTQIGLILAFQSSHHESSTVTALQWLMLALTVTCLILGAVVSERRRIEAQLHEQQAELAHVSRLSVAGELASALAHELNQPLSATLSYAQASLRLLAASDTVRAADAMTKAAAQAERAGEIIRRLRDFLRKGESRTDAVDVRAILNEAAALTLHDMVQHGVHLRVEAAAHLPPVIADKVQVEQVILNLLRNSLEAIVKAGSARREILLTASAGEPGFVEIAVADAGPGLPPDVAERLFMPFITTKAAGMGLGLSIGRSIIEAQGGRLWLAESGAGGCCFRFTLPEATTHG